MTDDYKSNLLFWPAIVGLIILIIVIIAFPVNGHAAGKTVTFNHGLMGQALAPMGGLARDARAKGNRVQVDGNPNGKDVVVAHSLSCLGALSSNAKKLILVDCPFWFAGANTQRRPCVHYMAGGGPRIAGCKNIHISGGHVAAPFTARRQILGQM